VSAGYSGTPLAKKLGCKPRGRLLTIGAPSEFAVAGLPEECSYGELARDGKAGEPGDVVVAFFATRAELAAGIAGLAEAIFPAGALWIAWPRRAAGHESDIREQDIRDLALPLGLVDNKVAALGDDWSGLRVVWRRERRGG
jgi:hypothetical protein